MTGIWPAWESLLLQSAELPSGILSLVLHKTRESSKEKKVFLSNTSTYCFHNGERLLSLKRVFDLKEYGHPNSLGYSDNLSHFIKKLQRNKAFQVNHSQILGLT